MDKLNDPERPLRVNEDVTGEGEGDGTGADGETERERWAGWAVLRPQDGNASAAGIGRALREHYEDVVEEPVPDSLKDILTRLG